MALLRQIAGFIYIIIVLILAFDVMYYLVYNIIPPVFARIFDPGFNFLDNLAKILSWPVGYPVELLTKNAGPAIRSILPVTETGIFGAKIAWVPIFALFLYTGIVKLINEILIQKRLDSIHGDYTHNQYDDSNK